MVDTKTCTYCLIEKELDAFGKNKRKKDGLQSMCKSCNNQCTLEWHKKNKEHLSEYKKEWKKNNKALVNSGKAKRVALKRQTTKNVLTAFDKLYIKCLYQVAEMRTRESGQSWHVDHIVPLQSDKVCGLHVPSNLRVISAFDNMSKSNRSWPQMWEGNKTW